MKRQQQHQRERHDSSFSDSGSDSPGLAASPFLRHASASSSRAASRERREPSGTRDRSGSRGSGQHHHQLFTPAGETLPPIATSRSTTAIFMKKKQMHQQNSLATTVPYPWTVNHISGSSSSSSSGSSSTSLLPHSAPLPPPLPLPNHPPPPYSFEPTIEHIPSTNSVTHSSRTSSATFLHGQSQAGPAPILPTPHSRNPSSSQIFASPPHPSASYRRRTPPIVEAPLMDMPIPVLNGRVGSQHVHNGRLPLVGGPSSVHPPPFQPHARSNAPASQPVLMSPPRTTPREAGASVCIPAATLFDRNQQRSSRSGSSEDDSDNAVISRGGDAEVSAIYTSPSRRRKGKERFLLAPPFELEDVGQSSSVHLHEGSLYDRRMRSGQYDEFKSEDDDDAGSSSTPVVMPKSCLKPTPPSSSASLAAPVSSSTLAAAPPQLKPNLGVRFVRFTLGLGGGKDTKGKEREREPRLICTTPGEACAGETETETDEPSQRRLPTARRPPSAPSRLRSSFGFGAWRQGGVVNSQAPPVPPPSPPPPLRGGNPLRSVSVPQSTSGLASSPRSPSLHAGGEGSKSTRFLFQAFRLLSIVPALCGLVFCVLMLVGLGGVGSEGEKEKAREFVGKYWKCDERHGVLRGPPVPERVDWVVAAFWALLTAHHCLGLSTGLLARWKLYYTPSSTLVRLLALQGICWPATHLTLSVVGGGRRPAAAWAVIGTCTAVSRSVQIWVTSNIARQHDDGEPEETSGGPSAMSRFVHAFAAVIGGGNPEEDADETKNQRRGRGRWWDWKEVGLKCMLPTGTVYFIMAWAEVGRREWGGSGTTSCILADMPTACVN